MALQVPSGVSKDPEAIQVIVHSTQERELLIGAYCRGRLLDFQQVQARANEALSLALKPAEGVGGVYRVTVFERSKAGEREQPDEGSGNADEDEIELRIDDEHLDAEQADAQNQPTPPRHAAL